MSDDLDPPTTGAVEWISGGTYKWTGDYPDVETKRKRRCRLGFTSTDLVIGDREFDLAIPLASVTDVSYNVGRGFRGGILRLAAAGGIDITFKETGQARRGPIVAHRIKKGMR